MPDIKDFPDHFWIYLHEEWGLYRFDFEDASGDFQRIIWEDFNRLKPFGSQDL